MAGQQVARRSLQHVDAVFYFPFDWAFIVRRTLNIVKPRVFIMMETEIWPNLLRRVPERGVKTVVINGRISSRSYPRYRLIRPFFRRVLADVDRFCMQSEESARRLIDLGADPARVTVTGSLKFDSLEVPDADRARQAARARAAVLPHLRRTAPVVIAGSTMRGRRGGRPARVRAHQDDDAGRAGDSRAAAARAVRRGRAARRARPGSSPSRRSELPIDAEPRADVVVLDTIGELAQLYQLATAVFVGGSLVDHGGHNILEPAIFGKPIVFGPHMQNFQEIADAFITNGAAMQVQSERELDEALLTLVTDPVRRARLGAAARALVEANRGAKDKTLAVIAELLPPASATCVRPGLALSVPSDWCIDSTSSSSMYGAVAVWRRRWYARDPSRSAGCRARSISVGNLSVGGSGKTPVVGYIARLLLERGERPAILTRGYGRRLRERRGHGRLGRHARSSPTSIASGDEPLMLARALPGVAVLVGASRYRAGPARRRASSARRSTCWTMDFSMSQIERDVDLLLLSRGRPDAIGRCPPAGSASRSTAAAAADAALVIGRLRDRRRARGADALGDLERRFRSTRTLGAPRRSRSRPSLSWCRRSRACLPWPALPGRSDSFR